MPSTPVMSFIFDMAQFAAATIQASDLDSRSEADVIKHMDSRISNSPLMQQQFAVLVNSLLIGRPSRRPGFGTSNTMLAATFNAGMQRFVIAHEFGHLIAHHLSTWKTMPAGIVGVSEYKVLDRTWPQEFEADSIGLQL